MSRADKIRAMLDSPFEGERMAAREALSRVQPPVRGSPEYISAVREFHRKIGFLSVNRNSALLSRADVRKIRNFAHWGGVPWGKGAEEIEALYRKLKARRDDDPIPMMENHHVDS